VRSALNKDLEALSKVYAERRKQIVRQGDVNRTLALALTGLGGLALVVVVIGVLIISRSVARPLAVITATIKRVARAPKTSRFRISIERRDRCTGASDPDLPGAMDGNRSLNTQVLQDSKAREERAGHIEASVESFRAAIGGVLRAVTDNASAMRDTAQSISRVAWMQVREPSPPPVRRASFQQCERRRGAAEELSASVEEIGRQVRQSSGMVEQAGLRTEKSITEIESLAAATQRIDGVLTLIQAIAEQTNFWR